METFSNAHQCDGLRRSEWQEAGVTVRDLNHHPMTDDLLRFPVGRFQRPAGALDQATRARHIATIAETPAKLSAAVKALPASKHETPYRPGGWTVRQVVHHVADSHMN